MLNGQSLMLNGRGLMLDGRGKMLRAATARATEYSPPLASITHRVIVMAHVWLDWCQMLQPCIRLPCMIVMAYIVMAVAL